RRRDEDARLAAPLGLAAAVEEVRDVCVLLGFGDVELADVMLGEHLRERLAHLLLAEDDRDVEVVAMPRHRRQVDTGFDELLRELRRAVRPKVEEDGAVAGGIEPGTVRDDDWLDELIRDPSFVTTPDGFDRIRSLLALAVDDRVEGALRAVPALVPVHRVVAA